MSWSVSLCDPVTLEIAEIDFKPELFHGSAPTQSYRREGWITVTSNYDEIYRRPNVFGPLGLQVFNGIRAVDSRPLLAQALRTLREDDYVPNYWIPTEGNARIPLLFMHYASSLFPSGIWEVV